MWKIDGNFVMDVEQSVDSCILTSVILALIANAYHKSHRRSSVIWTLFGQFGHFLDTFTHSIHWAVGEIRRETNTMQSLSMSPRHLL